MASVIKMCKNGHGYKLYFILIRIQNIPLFKFIRNCINVHNLIVNSNLHNRTFRYMYVRLSLNNLCSILRNNILKRIECIIVFSNVNQKYRITSSRPVSHFISFIPLLTLLDPAISLSRTP